MTIRERNKTYYTAHILYKGRTIIDNIEFFVLLSELMIEKGYFDAGISYLDDKEFILPMDYALLPIYFILILIFFYLLKNIFLGNHSYVRYFIPALLSKLIGSVVLGVVYQYYYGGGDTTLYYLGGRAIFYALQTDFEIVKAIYRSAAGDPDPIISHLTWYIPYFKDPNGFFTDKIMGFFVTGGAGYYLPSALLNAAFWFPGSWLLFTTATKICPGHDRLLAICTLFTPSLMFWGSGILKDTITLASVGYLTYGIYNGLILRRRVIFSLLLITVSVWLLIRIKPYIILSYTPGAILWLLISARNKMTSRFLKNIVTPVLLIIGTGIGALILTKASGAFEKYSVQNALETAQTFQQWHTYLSDNENASGYSLGVSGTSSGAIAASFLPAIGTTLFRPFLWEVHNPVMLFSSLESTIYMVVTLLILFRVGVRTFFSEIFKDPFLFFCFFFFMLFGFAVGFTAYNFGALVRYKIPCMPFYAIFLVILNYKSIDIQNVRKETKARLKESEQKKIKGLELQLK